MPVFLFSDIEGSAKKWELTPQAMIKAMLRHDELFLTTIKEFGGKAVLYAGDGTFAVFEDRQALLCALAIQEKVAKADWGAVGGIKIRIALNAGEAEKKDENYVGPVINRTAGILSTVWGGQIVLTPSALAESDLPKGGKTVPLGTHLLKDLSDLQVLLGLVHPSLQSRDFPPLHSLSTRPNNLPSQSTHFFGREEELKKIKKSLRDPSCHLLTLLGSGGIGKTRLVLQAAAEQIDDFADGVYFVSLAPVSSPDAVISAIAAAVQFSFSGEADMAKELLAFFKQRKTLLVLDNFEHLLPAAVFVKQLLAFAPGLKVLVSSRLRLQLPDEQVLELEGLEYPEEGTARSAESFSAFKFFINCVKRVRGNFSLKEEEVKEAARICQLVDGAPLGLELAAVWVQILSCREVRVEIEKNIDFLASNRQDVPERQRSLRAVFEYSWNLLSEVEKSASRAMSVFRGGFSTEQAEKVAHCPGGLLSNLVDRSLLHKNAPDQFEVHELLRQFFTAKLKESSEEYQTVHDRHMSHFLGFLNKRQQALRGKDEVLALQEIGRELNNIQEAWEWAVQTKNVQAINAASDPLYHYYEIKFLAQEGEKTFALSAATLEKPTSLEASLALSRVLARWGWFCYQRGRMDQAEVLMKKGLDLARQIGSLEDVGQCLHFLCALYRATGDYEQNEECAKESLSIFKALKDKWGTAWSLYHLVPKNRHDGNYASARQYSAESLELFRQMEYEDGAAWTLFGMGQIAVLQKTFDEAKFFFEQSFEIFERHGNNVAAGWVLIDLMRMYTSLEENQLSFELTEKAYTAFQSAGHALGLGWTQYYRSESAYHVRQYEESLRAGQEAIMFLDEAGGQSGQGWVCVNLCRTANALGRYEEGRNYGKKGIEVFLLNVGDAEGSNGCRIHLAVSETGLKNYRAAEELLVLALDNLIDLKIYWRTLEGVLVLAKLRAAEGRPLEALRFSSLVLQHPESQKEAKAEAVELNKEYAKIIKPDEAQKIMDATRTIDLVPFIKQFVAEYRTDTASLD